MVISTKGLVIKEQSLKDRDKLITILTEDVGVVRAFVHNVKTLNNKNSSSTGLMCYSSFVLFKGKDKYIVNESTPVEVFFNLRKDITKLSLVQYFCQLILLLCNDKTDSKELLKLLLNSIYMLLNSKLGNNTIKTVFEMRAMCIAGFMPNLICCKNCNKYESETMYFLFEKAELCCDACYYKLKHKNVALTRSALAALRHIIYSDSNKIFNFNIKGESRNIINIASENFVLSTLDAKISTLDFYKAISG